MTRIFSFAEGDRKYQCRVERGRLAEPRHGGGSRFRAISIGMRRFMPRRATRTRRSAIGSCRTIRICLPAARSRPPAGTTAAIGAPPRGRHRSGVKERRRELGVASLNAGAAVAECASDDAADYSQRRPRRSTGRQSNPPLAQRPRPSSRARRSASVNASTYCTLGGYVRSTAHPSRTMRQLIMLRPTHTYASTRLYRSRTLDVWLELHGGAHRQPWRQSAADACAPNGG